MSLRDAAQQALEALKIAQDDCIHGEMAEPSPIFEKAIHALEATLAEPQPEIEQLKAERDALLADAERYRWLRREDREFINDEMSNVGAIDSIMVCVFDDDCDAISFFEGELDAAIDAARGEK